VLPLLMPTLFMLLGAAPAPVYALPGADMPSAPVETVPLPSEPAPSAAPVEAPPVPTPPQVFIKVAVSEQKLYFFQDGQDVKIYPVSTSKYGVGNQAGSNKTPLGRHRVERKIGDNAPINTIFKARRNTGELAAIDQPAPEDFVTSRILWLRGVEEGVNAGPNVDSFDRYIYIHGTHEEMRIGQPASHGCIRMRNLDVIDLYEQTPLGTVVEIVL